MRDLLTIVASIVILILTLALVGPWFVDWTAQRGWVESELTRITGARVKVGGAIDLKLLPLKVAVVKYYDNAFVEDLKPGDKPVATAGHMHTMMAFPGQVLMEYNQGERPVPYLPDFLECRSGKVWPNDRPGLGVTVDERQLAFVEAITEGAAGATQRRLDGSLTHW